MGTGWSQKLPHNYEEILRDADKQIDNSSIEKLYGQLYQGVFLSKNQKKYWIEKETHYNCFMFFARKLEITWADDKRYWQWPILFETSNVNIDVAEMLNVCWLEVELKFNTGNLSPGIMYEILFVLMLRDPAYGWDDPVGIRLTLQDGKPQERKENFMEKPRGKWIEVLIGEFMVIPQKAEEIEVYMYEYERGIWKRGLVIKGVIVRPKRHK